MVPDLTELRAKIDEADESMLTALAERMASVEGVLQVKQALGLPLVDDQREQLILEHAAQRAVEHGLEPEVARRVLKEVMQISREIQAHRLHSAAGASGPLRIAFQGAEGAFSWIAARNRFGKDAQTLGQQTFAAVIEAVLEERADLAVLPVENTLAGSIHEVLDLLGQHQVHVIGEEILPINHCLIGLAGASREQIRTVLSHPVALQQCTSFLRAMSSAECRAFIDTAEAVAKVRRDQDSSCVAIAAREAAELYGLEVLCDGIADHPENYTRFWIIGRSPAEVDPRLMAKTSLLLVTDHREGALIHALQALAKEGVNMSRLESRPMRGTPWQYSFFIDIDGNLAEERVRRALDGMRARARVLRVLGCYPKAYEEASLRKVDAGIQAPSEIPMTPAPPGPNAYAPAIVTDASAPLYSRQRHPKDSVVKVGEVLIGGGNPFVMMAGPCAVESREQIQRAASLVKDAGAGILRGGAYKPRTSPYSFQGLGATGVKLLAEAGQANGMPVVCEVISSEQVAEMAQVVDLLQVGARNMQNFPLLRELGHCHRPVLLKRGISATIDELLQAAEYILSEGNQQVILCERGIRTFGDATRFTLDLGAVVVLKDRTHLPVVVDPSHAAGRREWVSPLARAACAAGCAGLIVEVHPEPQEAKCDAEQALGPLEFRELMVGLGIST